MVKGNLTVADLSRWFQRQDPTVRGWVNVGFTPGGSPTLRQEAEEDLQALEAAIRDKHLPVPPRIHPRSRIQLIIKLRPKKTA